MSKFSLYNLYVEIPLQGMEFARFSICGGLWDLRAVNLFTQPLNKLCLNSIPRRGIYRKAY
jgi:hypothetical protein